LANSGHFDCDCGHFDYTSWAIQLHVGVAKVQDTDKFVDKHLGCHSRSVSVNDARRSVTTFAVLAWLCFSVAFSTVFQAFLTTFLIDSGYKTPIQNMDELFASGIKLAYLPEHKFIFENGDDTEFLKVKKKNHVIS
jgi:hypothetical protein